METRHTYQYAPLQDGDIRILCLQPGKISDPLRGRLETAHLHTMAKVPDSFDESFEALSYAWGSDKKTHALQISPHGSLPITASLESALRRLRLPHRERRLWADAVCIHQSDTREKEQQVRLMAEIYSSARLVVADLGEASAESDAALDLIDRFWRAGICHGSDDAELGRPMTPSEIVMYLGLRPDDLDMAWLDHELPEDDSEEWLSVVHLFQRPWFMRIWIVQEFVLARDVVFHCGNCTIDWRHLFAAFLSYRFDSTWMSWYTNGVLGPEEDIGWDIFAAMAQNRALRSLQRTPESRGLLASLPMTKFSKRVLNAGLVDLLYIHRKSQCKLERDRYFALLRVASDAARLATCPELQPDYGTNDREWHLNVSQFLLRLHGGLDAFMYAGIGVEDEQVAPSWALNFGSSACRNFGMSFVEFEEASKAAGPDSPFIVSSVPRQPELVSVKGYRFDSIKAVVWANKGAKQGPLGLQVGDYIHRATETLLSRMDVTELDKTVLEEMAMAIVANPDPSMSYAARPESLRTLVPGMYLHLRLSGFEGPLGWEVSMGDIVEKEYGYDMSGIGEENHEEDVDSKRSLARAGFVANAFYPLVAGLSPATTETGNFANVPQGTSRRDEVWVVSGCRLPAVLRPSVEREGMHRLIGFCYATGVMNGEVLDRKGFAWQDVLLC